MLILTAHWCKKKKLISVERKHNSKNNLKTFVRTRQKLVKWKKEKK